MVCNDLTTALDGMGDLVEAERLIRRSLEIASSLKDQDVSQYLATFYFNLGTILTHKGTGYYWLLRGADYFKYWLLIKFTDY